MQNTNKTTLDQQKQNTMLEELLPKLIAVGKVQIVSDHEKLLSKIAMYEIKLNELQNEVKQLQNKCHQYQNIIANANEKNNIADTIFNTPTFDLNFNSDLAPIPPALVDQDDIDMMDQTRIKEKSSNCF